MARPDRSTTEKSARMYRLTAAALLLAVLTPASAMGDPQPTGQWPLRPTPEVVRDFDPPSGPYAAGHRGVDLAGSIGQAVHAAMPGKVAFAGAIAGKPVVTISHGATRTTYEPVDSDLAKGDPVAAGDRIGTLGVVFSHCFPRACLHWGWLRGEEYLDPLDIVPAGGRVRLLPLWRDEPAAQPFRDTPDTGPPALPYDRWRPVATAFLWGWPSQARGCACR